MEQAQTVRTAEPTGDAQRKERAYTNTRMDTTVAMRRVHPRRPIYAWRRSSAGASCPSGSTGPRELGSAGHMRQEQLRTPNRMDGISSGVKHGALPGVSRHVAALFTGRPRRSPDGSAGRPTSSRAMVERCCRRHRCRRAAPPEPAERQARRLGSSGCGLAGASRMTVCGIGHIALRRSGRYRSSRRGLPVGGHVPILNARDSRDTRGRQRRPGQQRHPGTAEGPSRRCGTALQEQCDCHQAGRSPGRAPRIT